MSTSTLLLKNGTALIHDDNDHVAAVRTDILIEDNQITKIETNIDAPPHATIVDLTDKIISPGFVDTHHHLWQTQFRGLHGNDTLLNYFPKGNFSSAFYSADDLFWGQLAGCSEAIDCGTTTVVDFSHVVGTHADNGMTAVAATAASGLRSIFCYAPAPQATDWHPFTIDRNPLGGHVLDSLRKLAESGPYGDGRVTVGFGFDSFHFLPTEFFDQLMSLLSSLKIALITTHYVPGPLLGFGSLPEVLEKAGHLDARFLMAHSSNMNASDVELYRKRGVHFSTTPSSEFQMSMGFPAPCYDPRLPDCQDLASLGVDCHSACSAFIPGEAKLALQASRGAYGQKFLDVKKQTRTVKFSVEEAFNQATIRGARAAKMGDIVGSIKVGKLADLVIFDSNSPSMVCGSEEDPIATVILHSSPKDIDMVIIDGIIRKRDGKLLPVKLGDEVKHGDGQTEFSWKDIARELKQSRGMLQEKLSKIDNDAAQKRLMEAWYIDPNNLVDAI